MCVRARAWTYKAYDINLSGFRESGTGKCTNLKKSHRKLLSSCILSEENEEKTDIEREIHTRFPKEFSLLG